MTAVFLETSLAIHPWAANRWAQGRRPPPAAGPGASSRALACGVSPLLGAARGQHLARRRPLQVDVESLGVAIFIAWPYFPKLK